MQINAFPNRRALETDLAKFVEELHGQDIKVNGNTFMLGTSMVVEFRRLLRARLLTKAGRDIDVPDTIVAAGLVITIERLAETLWPLVRAQTNASALA